MQVTTGSNYENGSIAIDDVVIKSECQPLGSCHFEEDKCLWTNDPESNLQWIRGTGEVTEAAPETDVTIGNQFGTYLYVHILNDK